MKENNRYFVRFLARIFDILLISIVLRLMDLVSSFEQTQFIFWYILYNALASILGGKTLGKYCFSLVIKNDSSGMLKGIKILIREFLVVFLFPILVLNFIFASSLPLHDRISGTRVVLEGE